MKPVNSQFTYLKAVTEVARSARTWVDLGCGHQFVPSWVGGATEVLPPPHCRVVGIDMDRDAIRNHRQLRMRILGTVEQIPLKSHTADLVTANMVLEHVENPAALFGEVARVLRPGGSFLVHTPNSHGYSTRLTRLIPDRWRPRLALVLQGRRTEDVYPTWYRANTLTMLRRLAGDAGLNVLYIDTVESSPQLYRVPVVGALEEWCLVRMRGQSWASLRPVILSRFVKPL